MLYLAFYRTLSMLFNIKCVRVARRVWAGKVVVLKQVAKSVRTVMILLFVICAVHNSCVN